jgi:hypothetical protein
LKVGGTFDAASIVAGRISCDGALIAWTYDVRWDGAWTIVQENGFVGKGFGFAKLLGSVADEVVEFVVLSHDIERDDLGWIVFLL